MNTDRETRERIRRITADIIPATNRTIAKLLLWFSAVCIGMLLLFRLGVLSSRNELVYAAFIAMPASFILSAAWCLRKKGRGRAFKYVFLFLLVLLWFALELMSGYKTKMLLPILIIISLLYFDKRATLFTYMVSSLSLVISNWCNAYLYAETGLLDINLVSFEENHPAVLQGFLYNNIIGLRPSSETLFRNGLLLNVFPNFIFLTAITVIAMHFMKQNLTNIVRAEQLAEKEANQRLELTEMRERVMLSQVKPHFVYNTLSSIAVLCTRDPAKAKELTLDFSEYLRNNLDTLGKDGVTACCFEDELEHIRTYLAIESVRFGDRLRVAYDIRESDFTVPALSVQPIVENAVKHGICRKKGGGTLTISTEKAAEGYLITVRDDGVGFEPGVAVSDGREHIGLENIQKRLALSGGELRIESAPGAGTTVTVLIKETEDLS